MTSLTLTPRQGEPRRAFVGATLIDATGAPAVPDAVVLVSDGRIEAAGPRRQVPVPTDVETVDLSGNYLLPGFMDGNVHLVPWPSWTYIEFLARYEDRFDAVALEAAQLALAAGFTTVFDTMGPLDSLVSVRDRLAAGTDEGARLFVAGNIVGFRAVFTTPESIASASRAFQDRINARFEAGGGPDLAFVNPADLRARITDYIAAGVDFVKYGATGDGTPVNSEIGQSAVLRFSPDQQRAIVESAHAAGVPVQTHTTSAESLHVAVSVGNDAGQHVSWTGPTRMYDETIALMLESGYVCGTQWGPLDEHGLAIMRDRNFADVRPNDGAITDVALENAARLLDAGVPQFLSTDAGTIDPDVAREDAWGGLDGAASLMGEAQFLGMRGMGQRGMSPMQVVEASTINVATAYGLQAELGTVEPGKVADLVALDRDPLADIENLRSVKTVVKEGRIIDRSQLPTTRLLTSTVDGAIRST